MADQSKVVLIEDCHADDKHLCASFQQMPFENKTLKT